jgi:hypothetical protein
LVFKTLGSVRDVAFNDVVAENDANLVPAGEIFRELQGIGNPALAFLVGVVQMAKAKLPAVAQQPKKIAGVAAAGHYQDLCNPGVDERSKGIEDHWLVIHGEQVLVGNFGQRKKTRSRPSSKYDSFQATPPPCSGLIRWSKPMLGATAFSEARVVLRSCGTRDIARS